jgi:flagellar basal body-associated protein FliL
MASKPKKAPETEEEKPAEGEAQPKKRFALPSKKMLIIIAGVLLLIGGGGGGYMMMSK